MRKIISYIMVLSFLPDKLQAALRNVNFNFINEIRLRNGQPVIIQYKGEYNYINALSLSHSAVNAIYCESAERVLSAAMERSVYAYAEQLKNGFITVNGGVRIGIAGEYVTAAQGNFTVKNVTSLNIRIPHDIIGAADGIYAAISKEQLKNTLIYSRPGYGKTTLLRDIARKISSSTEMNVLVFDERNEIAAANGNGTGFDLGKGCDVIRGANKLTVFANAIRVMRPQVIITDELYGSEDIEAVKYATECGIAVIASSHSIERNTLKDMPFELYVELSGIGDRAVVYDKDFNSIGNYSTLGRARGGNFD